MSISAMKCALQSLESVEKVKGWNKDSIVGRHCTQSAHFLRQAIAEAEKQEPVAWADMEVRGEDKGLSWTPGYFHTQPLYTAPVHASDISQEPVDETAKDEHEPLYMDMSQVPTGMPDWKPGMVFPAPKKEWVGLTDEEIDSYALDIGVTANKAPAWLVVYAKDIEAKLKEKNVPQS